MDSTSGYVIGIGMVLAALVASRVFRVVQEHDRILRRIDAFLTVWARYGEWNPECQAALNVVLRDTEDARSEPPTSMGMDFGVGLVWDWLWRRG